MSWLTGTVLYILIWSLTLFVVLPIGTRPAAEADAASGWRGAPQKPMMWRKVLATTLLATVLWAGAWYVIHSDLLSFRSGILALPD